MIAVTSTRDFGAALAALAICAVFLLWTQALPEEAAAMPKLVAWLAVALALIDVVAQTETTVGRALRRFVTAEKVIEWKPQGDGETAGLTRTLLSIAWVAIYLTGVVLVGFLLATPFYVFFYMLLHGGRSIRASAIAAVVTTFLIWLTFEVLFKYPLYPGMLFGGF